MVKWPKVLAGMGDSLRQAVQAYVAAGRSSVLSKVSTPFLNDSKAARRQDESDEPEGALARNVFYSYEVALYRTLGEI